MRMLAFATALALASQALAHDGHRHMAANELKQFGTMHHATPTPTGDVPLWSNLGTATHPISTTDALAQRYFDQGLMLAYGFNHAEAHRSFQAAQRLDPHCAMCFWGEALVLGPNINAPMDAGVNDAALEAVARARSLSDRTTPHERALIEAVAMRYSADPKAERVSLDKAYADAMTKVAAQFPEDRDIATLTAEALMDLSPWDYWQAGGTEPKGRTAEIVTLLERVLAADPEHTGAIHLYIHTVEASDRPERAEPYADRLAQQQLGAGHLVHMPSHIYYRLGRYADSLVVNRKAVAADEAFFTKVKAEGIYAGGYYPHNIHFLMVSAQMAGDGATVIEAAEKLERNVSDDAVRAFPTFQPVKAAPLFAHAQFSPPDRVLALPRPAEDLPYVMAMWHYARGVAYTRQGDEAAARAEADAIATLMTAADFKNLTGAGVPASDVLNVARYVLLGRIAQQGGDLAGAVKAFETAAAVEEGLRYMEPPFWYYPVRQSLGAALLMAGETDRAEEAFRMSLKQAPNNGWALYGLYQVQLAKGQRQEADVLMRRFEKAWAGERTMLALNRI